ncbi:12193_t:CDS:1 [Acaulospora colombiana]|uniref:12193_t:CDS:1 n=1 Tax=Acaulospora colombiana TaxID=27376 RepID=A0ACA9KV09_9GLOM|nr:12193_t:CDS:1 [Acaulospora colombiana]
MLAIVARPVQDWLNTPSPKYSRILPVPPYAAGEYSKKPTGILVAYLHGKLAGKMQYEIFGAGPPVVWEFAFQVYASDHRCLKFPRSSSHRIDGISASYTNSKKSKATSIRGMAICA